MPCPTRPTGRCPARTTWSSRRPSPRCSPNSSPITTRTDSAIRKIAAGLFTSLDGVVESLRRSAPASCTSVTRRFLEVQPASWGDQMHAVEGDADRMNTGPGVRVPSTTTFVTTGPDGQRVISPEIAAKMQAVAKTFGKLGGKDLSQMISQALEQASGQPSGQPFGQPSGQPFGQPSGRPSGQPSGRPFGQPDVPGYVQGGGQAFGPGDPQAFNQAGGQAFGAVDPQAFHQPGGQPDEHE